MTSQLTALTHVPSPRMSACELTFIDREPIDGERARQQHQQYCTMLSECGAAVQVLDVNRDFPDSAFIEDAAVVLDEIAVLASMGAESRRGELAGIAGALKEHREVRRIEVPARIDGGDVLQIGRTLLVGQSSRTNEAGLRALKAIVGDFGYEVLGIPVRDCLHLKTACTAIDDGTLLVNSAWVDDAALNGFKRLGVPASEPWAANILRVGDYHCLSDAHPRTADVLTELGATVKTIDNSEFAKAEAGVTCLSLLFRSDS